MVIGPRLTLVRLGEALLSLVIDQLKPDECGLLVRREVIAAFLEQRTHCVSEVALALGVTPAAYSGVSVGSHTIHWLNPLDFRRKRSLRVQCRRDPL